MFRVCLDATSSRNLFAPPRLRPPPPGFMDFWFRAHFKPSEFVLLAAAKNIIKISRGKGVPFERVPARIIGIEKGEEKRQAFPKVRPLNILYYTIYQTILHNTIR